MEKLTRSTFVLVLLFLSSPSVFSQTTMNLGSVSGNQNTNVILPVYATNINDMAGFQFSIQYDNTKLSYVNCTNWGGGINSGGVQIVSLPFDGKLTFVYDDLPVNISNGRFFDIIFSIKSGTPGTTTVSWTDEPTIRELYNSIPEVIPCSYSDGIITILDEPQPAYKANFTITSYGTAIQGASVELSGYGTQLTDNNGSTIFTNLLPSGISYSVTKAGYYENNGTLSIVDNDVTENVSLIPVPPVTYQVAFNVRSGYLPVSGALVSLSGYGSKYTDSNGSAIFVNVAPSENLPYTVEKTGYLTKNGSLSVYISNITENIDLTSLAGADLSFGNVSAEPGTTVAVPVMAFNIVDVTGFQFTIVYDNSRLTYTNCSDWSGGTNGNGVQINHLSNDGKITFIYNDVGVNISSGRFFNLNFIVNENVTGDAQFSWSDIPTIRELSNSKPEIVSCNYTGGKLSIITASLPEVTTLKTCPVTSTTAAGGGIVVNDGGGTVNSRGICWGLNPNPTIQDTKVVCGNGTGEFATTLVGLSEGTQYHVRAFASNSAGTSYGDDLSFIILPAPTNVIASDGLYWDKVTIEWTGVNSADSYNIYRNNSFLVNVLTTVFNDDNPLPTDVEYKIYSVNTCGLSYSPGLDHGSIKVPVLYAASDDLSFDWMSGNTSLSITANMDWEFINQSDWLSVVKQNESSLLITYSANASLTDRRDTLILSSIYPPITFKVTVYQKGQTTGITEDYIQKVAIFPNPAGDFLNIKTDLEIVGNISITDMYGKTFFSSHITGSFITLNIKKLPKGFYILKIKNDTYTSNFRFIKDK